MIFSGTVIVDISTPTPLTLIDLIKYSTPVVVPIVIPEDPVWTALHDALRNAVDTDSRTNISQISSDDTYTTEIKQLIENTRLIADMSEESVITNVGTTNMNVTCG